MCPPDDKQRAAMDAVLPLVYDELRQVAHCYFRNQPSSFTMRPTDVVDEACLHLLRHSKADWQSPEHFRAIATKKIWQVIVDHLRSRHAQKRGGVARAAPAQDVAATGAPDAAAPARAAPARQRRLPLDAVMVEWRDQTVDLLDLADALEDLSYESHRLREIVMLHWFGGLKYPEVARLLNLSESSVEKDFRYALAWLNRRLAGGRGDGH